MPVGRVSKDGEDCGVSVWRRHRSQSAGLEHLKNLTGLEALLLYDTQITDGGLAHLSGLIGLRSLNLTQAQITDVGLAHLKDLTGLQVLDLSGTRITDAVWLISRT